MGIPWSGSPTGGRWKISTLLPRAKYTARAGTGITKSARSTYILESNMKCIWYLKAIGRISPIIFARSVLVSGCITVQRFSKAKEAYRLN